MQHASLSSGISVRPCMFTILLYIKYNYCICLEIDPGGVECVTDVKWSNVCIELRLLSAELVCSSLIHIYEMCKLCCHGIRSVCFENVACVSLYYIGKITFCITYILIYITDLLH